MYNTSRIEESNYQPLTCPDSFEQVSGRCFLVVNEAQSWDNAEADCSSHGNHVHLAGMETQVVSSHISIKLKQLANLIYYIIYSVSNLLVISK